ncbi:MAG: trigger factor [Candidatus Omnitrophica bacterium]|nr:trigger factor [Candidatus Omnitrophota bacterium]
MKIRVKDTAKCQKVLEIEVPKQTITEEFDRFYNEIKKTAEVPGFRKGKAPRDLLEKHFANKAQDKVLANLLNDAYQKAVEKEKLQPAAMPEISEVNFKKDESLSFHAKIDIKPNFPLKEYKKIKLKKQKLMIKDEEIEKVLGFLQERYAQFNPAENRAVKISDYIICDYSYCVDGKEIEKKEHIWLFVNKEMFIPGLEKEICGLKPQEKKEFSLTLPKKFQPTELAQKEAKFSIFVKEIKEKKLQELNEEFAKTLGRDSLDELKKVIKDDLTKEKDAQIKLDIKSQIVNYLVKTMPIDVPPTLVERREKALRDSFRQKLTQQRMPEERIKDEEKNIDKTFKEEALKQVRVFFILDEISKKENIAVESHELDKRIELIAQSYNQKKDEVIKFLQEKDLLENIHWEIWEEKAIDFLTEQAEIEEVDLK